ncbi:MAG: glycerophosphodiester phosphodiesterase family protein [Anaerovoracaceae bacterium]|jgi:glycerophosphoryl diester phosphodiesterase
MRIKGKDEWLLTRPIAHRGLHDREAPENSMGAFRKAVEADYPMELDVHISRDGELFIMHDGNIRRMTGVDRKCRDLFSEDLDKYRLSGTEYTIPRLKDVLEMVAGRVPVLIEIKNGNRVGRLERVLHEMLQNYPGLVAIESFDPFAIYYMKKLSADYCIGQLSEKFRSNRLPRIVKWGLSTCKMNFLTQPDFIAYDISELPLDFLRRQRKNGIALLGWTVKDRVDEEFAIKQCDNYIFENIRP